MRFAAELLFVSFILTATTCRQSTSVDPVSPVPAVFTDSSSNETNISAILCGRINPQGVQSTWYFEFGTTTSYGIDLKPHDSGSGTKWTSVSDTVSNLSQGTYHFRLVARTGTSVVQGLDQAFTLLDKFIYPLSVGNTWTYRHVFTHHYGWAGDYDTTKGIFNWAVTSVNSTDSSTTIMLACSILDTVHLLNIWTSHRDSTYIRRDVINFSIEVSRDVIDARWRPITQMGSGFPTILERIPRFLTAASDRVGMSCSLPGGGGWALSAYRSGIGLTEYSAYQGGGVTDNYESLTLLSYSVKYPPSAFKLSR